MKTRNLLLILVFITSSNVIYGQLTQEDSLKAAFFSATSDTAKRNRLEQLMLYYMPLPTKSPQECYDELASLIRKKGDPNLEYLVPMYYFVFLHTPDSVNSSKIILTEFLEQCLLHNDDRNYVQVSMMLANIESMAGQYDISLKLLLQALDIAKNQLQDKELLGGVYLSLANFHYEQRDTLKAIEFNTMALKVLTEIRKLDYMASVSNNLAMQYSDLGRYDSAEYYFRESIRLFHLSIEDPNLRLPMINLAEVFRLTHKYDSAFIYTRTAIGNAIEINDEPSLSAAYWQIAKTFKDVGKQDSALKYFLLAKELNDKMEIPAASIVFYGDLAGFYASIGDHKSAYEYLLRKLALQDMVFNAENNKVLKEMDVKYQASQQEKEILKQEEQIKRQRILNYSMIVVAVIFLTLLFFIYRSSRLKQKSNKLLAIAKEKAEQSEKFKQQFLANMSHEIRTPMNAVMGMTNLLIEQNPRTDQKHYLDGIKISSDNLLHIINDILDLSKIEAGKMELENLDFSIREMAEQVKQMLSHKSDEKGLELIVDIDPGVPDVMTGDAARLNQVLLNLAGNAVKFTEKGSVTISATPSGDPDESEEKGIIFSIIDTGIGIPENKLQSVFDSFSQANTSDTRKFGGTGLGLSISKQLVELMGGTIAIESKEGSGTTFSFEIRLPVGSRERMNVQNAAGEIDGTILNGLKILIVDDNAYNRIVAHDTLKSKSDVEITLAENGSEAVAILCNSEFDVVLMDVQMPVMDGYEATRQIRNSESGVLNHAVPVIALTASVIRSDLDKCRESGMDDYVPKPFKTSQLIAAVARATGREIKQAPKVNNPVKPDPANQSPVTNLTYLHNFCEGNQAQMQKYITMFTSSAPELIKKLDKALSANDFEEIARQVHGYKTKWIMMGMTKSKDLAGKIESRCRDKSNKHPVKEDVLMLIGQIETAKLELS